MSNWTIAQLVAMLLVIGALVYLKRHPGSSADTQPIFATAFCWLALVVNALVLLARHLRVS